MGVGNLCKDTGRLDSINLGEGRDPKFCLASPWIPLLLFRNQSCFLAGCPQRPSDNPPILESGVIRHAEEVLPEQKEPFFTSEAEESFKIVAWASFAGEKEYSYSWGHEGVHRFAKQDMRHSAISTSWLVARTQKHFSFPSCNIKSECPMIFMS